MGPSNAAEYPDRSVLVGVPKLGFGIHTCPFVGSLHACLRFLGDAPDYDYVMAVSGAAFRRFWHRDDGGNIDLMYLSPEPHRRAFAALGYSYQAVPSTGKPALVAAIQASIARGRPVLAFGIIGPPECGIVAGYDRAGEVLIGYSYFQDSSLEGYSEQSGWFERPEFGAAGIGCIAIGDRRSRPSEREILASTLAWAIDIAYQPRPPTNHLSGLAAYAGWASGLETDADYPDEPPVLATRAMVHGDQATMLYERVSAARYLRASVSIAPEAATPLAAAARHYDAVVGELAGVWRWGHEMGPEVARGLVDPSVRRDVARHVRLAGASEARAVEQLASALSALTRG
jgi:hypothetical protein